MSVPAAYLGIILIWSTTPLALQWSTQGTGFAFAVLARMVIGFVVAATLLRVWRIGFPLHQRARRAYLVGGFGMFSAMALTYWSAQHIASGLISVLYGLTPLFSALLAMVFLGERSLTPVRLLGILTGISGLVVIFLQDGQLGKANLVAGLLAMLLGVLIYAGSIVWLKQIGDDSPPLATTVGALGVSLPLFLSLWLVTDGMLPTAIPLRSLTAIVYLGLFGSVLGFALYYYVIKHLPAASVGLITLITPVMALLLGHSLNGEVLGWRIWLGAGMILLGLLAYQWESLKPLRWHPGRFTFAPR
jgi:drug/metabolite transporter (DMT)-like permease